MFASETVSSGASMGVSSHGAQQQMFMNTGVSGLCMLMDSQQLGTSVSLWERAEMRKSWVAWFLWEASVVGQSPHHHHTLSASCLESLRCCCCTRCQYPSPDGGRARHCSELSWRRPCRFHGPEVLESLIRWKNALAHSTRSDRTGFTPLTFSLTAFFSESLSSLGLQQGCSGWRPVL